MMPAPASGGGPGIYVRGLRSSARIGVTEQERAESQPLIVSVEAELDLDAAARTDALEDTLDYGSLVERIDGLLRGTNVHLLERAAGMVADLVLEMEGVTGVRVEIHKEHPPLAQRTDGVGVRIVRRKR